ncbi:MAG: hypothetical protein H6742_04160 [Alphaproteobacteria bacterium]|nr:hypothetical protein [Alphaproteobacteria bacterium]
MGRISALADELGRQGIQARSLRALQEELDAIEEPSALSRMTAAARASAARHWAHVVGELQESAEVMGILSRRVSEGRTLSDEETDKVRSQLFDLLRVVPAGLLAVANSSFPIPGTGLLTPWLLQRLGLMPSRWREAHLLSELEREEGRLLAEGHARAAAAVHALAEDLEEEADAREAVLRDRALLTFWDADRSGTWDEEERAAYRRAVTGLRARPPRERSRRIWFVRIADQLFGPCRITELPQLPADTLVSVRDGPGWVALDDLLGAHEPLSAAASPAHAERP